MRCAPREPFPPKAGWLFRMQSRCVYVASQFSFSLGAAQLRQHLMERVDWVRIGGGWWEERFRVRQRALACVHMYVEACEWLMCKLNYTHMVWLSAVWRMYRQEPLAEDNNGIMGKRRRGRIIYKHRLLIVSAFNFHHGVENHTSTISLSDQLIFSVPIIHFVFSPWSDFTPWLRLTNLGAG